MFSRLTRLLLAAVLALAAIGYTAVRLGGAGPRAVAATTPPTIKIGHNAQLFGFTTRKLTIKKGQVVRVVNGDTMRHTVTSFRTNSHGDPLFNVSIPARATARIRATAELAPGKYRFRCLLHPQRMVGTLTVKGSGGGTTGSGQTFALPLRIPKVITGSHPVIPVERAAVQVFAHGPRTMMWTYGGSFPGPTIRRPSGAFTKVTFQDKLTVAGKLSVHLHGDHHASASDGQPDSNLLAPGHSRSYGYPLKDNNKAIPGAFFYYHDHRMMRTGRNNWMGLQGMFVVDNPSERKYDLPGGRYDVPLAVTDRSFTKDNQLLDPFPKDPMQSVTGTHAPPNDATVGTTVLVNGEYSPHFDVATHRYRLRILNSSNFQAYDFELSDGRSFTQLGSGDSLFPKPVVRKHILLGPSERADVVVNFGGELGKRVYLKSSAGSASVKLMQFRVTRRVSDSSRVPANLLTLPAQPPLTTPGIAKTWDINDPAKIGNATYWRINGKAYDPTVSQFTVKRDSTQRWSITNRSMMTHYFHIHEEQWRTISRSHNGSAVPVPAWERGLQDTWQLNPGDTVVVEGTFSDYLGRFMVHCHMLDHEDDGLMAQFTVVK
ncbi:MAG TPA: multicopper oxidase domain-containing protein [Jatrophihabitans sp.]|jgi:FtsP/CotA-like multicopper oxidase with cupredoxin domain/plastocyanin